MGNKIKCEDIGFEHCWMDITPAEVYCTNPPTYPARRRKCVNCGREEIEEIKQKQREIKEWKLVGYSDV